MREKALAKLDKEMAENKDLYSQALGNMLKEQVKNSDEAAGIIANTDITIASSLEVVKVEAKSKAVNGCAVLTDEEVYKIVLNNYGIKTRKKVKQEVKKEVSERVEKAPETVLDVEATEEELDLSFDLDDYL